VALLILNVYGLFKPWESSLIYSNSFTRPPGGSQYSYLQTMELLNNLSGEPADIASQATDIIFKRMVHYWDDVGIDAYHLRIPIYKNYLFYLLSFIKPSIYLKYETCDPNLALARGVGLCSQQTLALVGVLQKKDISARTITLNGHVVATAQVSKNPEAWWIFDPDYGVVIPHSIEELEKDQTLVASYYKNAGYADEIATWVINKYTGGKNVVWSEGIYGYPDCSPFKSLIRTSCNYLIWIVPVLGIISAVILFRKLKNNIKYRNKHFFYFFY